MSEMYLAEIFLSILFFSILTRMLKDKNKYSFTNFDIVFFLRAIKYLLFIISGIILLFQEQLLFGYQNGIWMKALILIFVVINIYDLFFYEEK